MEHLHREQDLQDVDLVITLREELHEANEKLYATRKELRRQQEIAAKVHRSLLPAPMQHSRIDVDVRHIPAEPLGSDYFQVRIPQDDPDACYVTMCHAEGEGIVPALLASRISSEARHYIEELFSPADMVHALNGFIHQNFQIAEMQAAFMAARIDLNHRCLTYSGAGHPGGMLFRPGEGVMQRLTSQHRSIGKSPEILTTNSEGMLKPAAGDRLLFFTSGIVQCVDADGRLLGHSGLAAIAGDAMSYGLFEMLDEVVANVRLRGDGQVKEDMTLVIAELK